MQHTHTHVTISCAEYAAAVASLGVTEFSSFATLTVKELTVPGLGIPRPAVNRIAQLAQVYQKQSDAEDEEKEAARFRAKQGRLKKKRQQFDENVIEEVDDNDNEEVGDNKGYTIDGKYFFTSMKELKQVWGEASLVHRAKLDDGHQQQLTSGALSVLGDQAADFSSIDGYHEDDLDSIAAPPPPPSAISSRPVDPDKEILDDYMRRLLRPSTPEPPPPIHVKYCYTMHAL
jgi:hypothetical protein